MRLFDRCFAVGVVIACAGCSTPSTSRDADLLLDAGDTGDAADAKDAEDASSDEADEDADSFTQSDSDLEPLNAEDYCETAAPLFCPFYLRCGRLEAPDETACEASFIETCNSIYESRYVALVEAGFLRLSAPDLIACGEHLSAVSCDDHLMDLEGPCATVWQGQVPAGGSCGFDVESFVCSPGTRCVLDLSLCGTCKAIADVGETCGGDVTCGADARCSEGFCVARAALGDSCSSLGECRAGSSCLDDQCQAPHLVGVDEPCGGTLERCRYMTRCVAGTCQPQSLLGELCDATTTCASGFCVEDGQCGPFTDPGAVCEEDRTECLLGCSDGQCAPLASACL